MKGGIGRLVALPLLLVGLAAAAADLPVSRPEPTPKLVKKGKRLYRRRCVFCHGWKGDGHGPVARGIFPKPRDFTRGIFKIRSTPTGSPPTDEDLFETIGRGMPGTMMPSFSNLTDEQRWALVYYVKSFFTDPAAPSPEAIQIPEKLRPQPTFESIARGRQIFLQFECWKCHGLWGHGDGPSSQGMVDDWGYPIRVADLNHPKLLRGGYSPRELYRTIATGVGGTPMPAFGEALKPEDLWHLVNYLEMKMQEGRDGK